MNIALELKTIIDKKEGNKELALFGNADGWSFHLGNPTNCVNLGEVEGVIETSGKTIEAAIIAMEAKLGIWG